ncbi:MAG: 4-demethylwyosine synthase TYW1 [Candidatus Pacearchaeota archaeon]|nr:4-demethylwyosine synthase TYW1 [Candidatus Pacearchaeota archaeon]
MKPPKKFSCQIDLSKVALPEWKAKRMYLQGYRFVGKHSAIKICEWTKKALRGENFCFKQKFYGIQSHRCVQMSPAAFFCDFNCLHCWRSLNFTLPPKNFKWDSPEFIYKESINAFKKAIAGFKGNPKVKKEIFFEADSPNLFAISLSGEPTIYPRLPEFIDLIKSKNKKVFLVTNGAHPDMIKKLINHEPTFFYLTLPAPNKEIFQKECCPIIKDGWKKLNASLSLLKKFSCNTVIRLTLSKSSNMLFPEQYAKIIEKSNPKFVEVKAYMAVGGARTKMPYSSMPSHDEIIAFAKEIEKNSSYKIINEKQDSRVVLLSKSKQL